MHLYKLVTNVYNTTTSEEVMISYRRFKIRKYLSCYFPKFGINVKGDSQNAVRKEEIPNRVATSHKTSK